MGDAGLLNRLLDVSRVFPNSGAASFDEGSRRPKDVSVFRAGLPNRTVAGLAELSEAGFPKMLVSVEALALFPNNVASAEVAEAELSPNIGVSTLDAASPNNVLSSLTAVSGGFPKTGRLGTLAMLEGGLAPNNGGVSILVTSACFPKSDVVIPAPRMRDH